MAKLRYLKRRQYMNKKGKIEASLPATSYEEYPVKGNIDRLRAFSQPHHTTDKQ